MKPSKLQPGDELDTPQGRAVFLQFKGNNLKGQTYQVQLKISGKTHWYTAEQLKDANHGQEVTV